MTLAHPDQIASTFERILEEMDRRIQELLKAKQDKLTDFTEQPRLFILVEEYVSAMAALDAIDTAAARKAAEKVAPKVRAALFRLCLESRKIGGSVFICAQRSDAQYLGGLLRSQLIQKFSMRQDPDGLLMNHPGISPEEVEKAQSFRPGHGYAQFPGAPGLVEFQADMITYQEFRQVFEERERPPRAARVLL